MRRILFGSAFMLSILLLNVACSSKEKSESSSSKPPALAFKAQPSEPLKGPSLADDSWIPTPRQAYVIQNATIMTATGKTIPNGYVIVEDGRIQGLGEGRVEPEGRTLIDAKGGFVTPGIIDSHSHIGVYSMPSTRAHSDGNEMTSPSTADVWAEHSFWPQDPSIWRAVSGGVTTIQVLPGSANLIGGRSVSVQLIPNAKVTDMKFPGAPQGVKMACGENPKTVYGSKGGPATRMGNVAGFRRNFQQAFDYGLEQDRYARDLAHWQARLEKIDESNATALKALGDPPKAPSRNHAMDTLSAAMRGDILVHVHCYRADEMEWMLDLAESYGFHIRSFHHALEAYKLRERLAALDTSVSTWADWWGFKMEAFDGIPHNAALIHDAGARAIIHSDSAEDIRFLNIEAAKAQAAGRQLGITVSDEEALQWITLNPAWALGIDDQAGSIEQGKMADLVIWDRHPFSAYAKAEKVFIRGSLVFDRPSESFALGDFESGIRDYGLGDRGSAALAEPGAGIPESREAGGSALNQEDYSRNFAVINVEAELGNGGRLRGATILVQGGLIKAIGRTGEISVPQDLPVIDGKGLTISPGFIEAQSMLATAVVPSEEQARDHSSGEGLNPGFEVIDGYDPFSLHLAIAREHGITTAVIRPTGGMIAGSAHVVDLRESVDAMNSPADNLIFASIRSREENRGAFWLKLREAFDDTRFFMEHLKSENKTSLAYQLSLKPIHLKALSSVLKGESIFVLEAHRLSDIYAALRLKADIEKSGYQLRLMLSGAGEAWLARDELAKAEIPVIIAPSKQLPYSLDMLRVRDDNATLLAEAGVPLIISASDRNIRRLRQQAGRAVAYGLAYGEAIQAMTGTPARVLGLSDRGTLEPGKRADMVLWSGDPLEPQGEVLRLWIAGDEQSLENRQRVLSRKYMPGAVSH